MHERKTSQEKTTKATEKTRRCFEQRELMR